MTVKVVTDSTSDIPDRIVKELDIEVVPVYVYFGKDEYRDGVDLTDNEFYQKLQSSPYHPRTSQPSPDDFATIYRELYQKSDGVVSIVISSKISGVYNSAVVGKETANLSNYPVEVIDSKFNSVGLGLVVIAAAKIAKTGGSLNEVIAEANKAIGQVKMLGMFDTLKYLIRGGRVSKLRGNVADFLGIKPLLTFRDGEIVMAGMARSYNKGIDTLVNFATSFDKATDIVIAHSSNQEAANMLKTKLSDKYDEDKILISELGSALGAHGGPGVLLLALKNRGV